MKTKVKNATQSPMNKLQWHVTLECGHEGWMTGKRKPTTGKCVDCIADRNVVKATLKSDDEAVDEESTAHKKLQARLGAAISTMPCGAMVHLRREYVGHKAADITLAWMADYLEALRGVLEDVTRGHQERDKERVELVQQRAAIRAFLGLL